MGRKLIDLTGQRFGKLTVISFDHRGSKKTYWNCSCDCGGKRTVSSDHLKSGEIIDCGCYKRHVAHMKKNPIYNTRLYRIWSLMKERCFNEKRKEYPNYGGRGIRVCDEWMNSESFINWSLSNGYKDGLTLDRIDNNGNYCPDNCRWVDRKVQGLNKRNNRYITHNGETKTITQWAKDSNLPYHIIKKRIDILGWSFEDAISKPIIQKYSSRKG